jgi:hypothetical protein
MEHYYKKFISTLKQFINDLDRYAPNRGCQDFLKCFDQLHMHKVILRYVGMMREHEQALKNCDESIFNNKLIVFPGIDLAEIWPNVANEKKKKLFIYLHTLLVISDMMIQLSNSETPTPTSSTLPVSNVAVSKDGVDTFDPFVGVGRNDDVLDVNNMFDGELPPEEQTAGTSMMPGLNSLMGMSGFNMNELTDQLKNMNKDDIDDATNSIQSLLGSGTDDQTSGLISDMLTNIRDELKNDDISSGNPVDNILKIAESVANKMKPQMENSQVDMSQLFNSTKNLADNCKDKNGNSLFAGGANPFELMTKMMGSMSPGMMPPGMMPPGMMPTTNTDKNKPPISQDEYLKYCQDNLGLDLSNLNGGKRGGKKKK